MNKDTMFFHFSLTRRIKAMGVSKQVEAMKTSPYEEYHEPVPGTNLHATSGKGASTKNIQFLGRWIDIQI